MGTSQFGVEGDIDMGLNNSSRLTVRFVIVLLVAMLPSVGMVVFNALKLKKYHTEEAVEALQWSVGEISRHHLHEIRATHTLFYSLAQMPEVRRPDATACQALFAELQGLSRFYDNIGLVGKDGYVLASAVPFSGQVYVGDREHVQQAIQSRDFATSKLQMGRILQKP